MSAGGSSIHPHCPSGWNKDIQKYTQTQKLNHIWEMEEMDKEQQLKAHCMTMCNDFWTGFLNRILSFEPKGKYSFIGGL